MAARNVKSVSGFDAADKMQSSTLKRQPSPDWSKNDLLRLLSYFEGELQARDITIAALKAEKAKQLLYQAKYGRFGLGDPFVALQRDAIGTRDSNFDEAAVKSMYDNQLAQLENLIATQRKAQLKMREQLANAEKRYHKVCSELEEEKRKHAQDTAQGDDVTYMLEKERERLKQEIDFEKSNSKKLEKDLRRTLAALEEERASANRHKQVALLLLKERKHILQKLAASGQSLSQGDYCLPEEMRAEDMVEGLEVDPQRSMTMEAALEEQLGKIEAERTAFQSANLEHEQSRTHELERQVEALQRQVQNMAAQSGVDTSETKPGALHRLLEAQPPGSLSSLHSGSVSPIASSSVYSSSGQVFLRSPVGLNSDPTMGRPVAVIGATASPHVRLGINRVVDGGHIGSISPEREVIHRPMEVRKMQYSGGGYASTVLEKQGSPGGGGGVLTTSPREARVVTVGSSGPDSSPLIVGGGGGSPGSGARVNISAGNNATVVTQGAGKISFHVSAGTGGMIVGGAGVSQRQGTASPAGAGRGNPPPVPPNKPNIPPSSTPPGKPAPPPKVAVMGGRERGGMESKVVQIPVNVVTSSASSSSSTPSTGSQSSRESSPIRKTAQLSPPPVAMEVALAAPPNPDVAQCGAGLDFLGPEMASLQELIAALSTGEASARDSPGLASPSPSSSPSSSHSPSAFFPTPSTPLPPSSPPSIFLSSPPPPQLSLITPSTVDIQNSAVHKMAACGDHAALRTLILDHDADVNLLLKDGTTPVHCAVENDRETCLQLLLDKGGNAGALRDDRVTPVHIAAALGHSRCLKLLLERGAAASVISQTGDTPLHLAVEWGHLSCCQLLLLHGANVTLPRQDGLTAVHYAVWRDQPEILRCLLERLPAQGCLPPCLMGGHTPGSSLAHLAAQLPSEACLRVLLERLSVDLKAEDAQGRSVLSVSSPACKALLTHLGEQRGASLNLMVELKTQLEGTTVSCTRIGSMDLGSSCSWRQLEEQLRGVLSLFLSQLDQGLRTRRLLRMEAEVTSRNDFSLGITMSRISMFQMGFYRWTPGMQTEKLPYSIVNNTTEKKVAIIIDDTDNFCELIAFDILHPVPVLQDYLRLLDQYKSVVFHGPVNSGKSYLVQRLAQCWAARQKTKGEKPVIGHLKLSSKTSHEDLIAFLKQKGFLLPVDRTSTMCPLLIVDNMEKVSLTDLFGPLLDPLAHRGKEQPFCLTEHINGNGQKFYFPENFCILATLNRSRSTGIELHIQQRFRWVHFRHDTEPLRNLLSRHFLRRLYHLSNGQLPGPDDPLLRATEWIICIWQRLNDSLGKLGLPDVVFGPCSFFKCPLEKKNPQLILQWVQDLWNQSIAPQVRETVKKSTGTGGGGGESANGGQQRVANTALYVLMQRAVVVSCPLPVKEKEAYLQGFSGSNELDLPFRSDKGRQVKTAHRSESEKAGGDNSSLLSAGASTSLISVSVAERLQNQHASSSSVAKTPNKQREERGRSLELFTGSNIKRRSLSESSMNKAARHLDQLEQEEEERQQQQQHHQQFSAGISPVTNLSHHAKVPKLEVRSSKILSLSNSFKMSPSSVLGMEMKSGQVSPLSGRLAHHHHQHHHQHKKSRSSENISPSGLYSGKGMTSPNPFSFSLSTPKSSLMSFKFFDKSSASEQTVFPTSAVTSQMSDSASSGGGGDADLSSAQTQTGGSAAMDVHSFSGQEASGSV